MESYEDWLHCLGSFDPKDQFLGAASPPIYETAPFMFDTYEDYAQAEKDNFKQYVYWRGTNPTVEAAEKMLAALEHAEAGKCFASGMAAVCAAIMSCLSAGEHIVLAGHVYETSVKLVKYLAKFSIRYTLVHSIAIEDIERAIEKDTRAILLESPTSFLFDIVDIREVAKLARSRGIRTLIDNSWATPLYQKPIDAGIDIVVHSASKYLGGHNDLVGGVVLSSEETIKQMFSQEYELMGASMGPFEAWLLIRGLRTLPIRMDLHMRNGLEIARFLESQPGVSKVNHPGLPSHPHHELAGKQMKGYAGLFSFELNKGNFERIKDFTNRLKLIRIGSSWGAPQSQIISPNYGYNEEKLEQEHIPRSLIRLAVGHEPAALLIQDLEQALGSLGQ